MKIIILLALQSFVVFKLSAQMQLLPIKSDYKWGYCDTNGDVIIEPQFDYAEDFVCDVAKVKLKGKLGVIDAKGKIIIEPNEEAINVFCPNYISVKEDSLWGLDNSEGKKLIEPNYSSIELLGSSIFLLKKGNTIGLFDAMSNTLVAPEFQSIVKSKYFYLTKKNDQLGLLDKNLKKLVENEFIGLEILDSTTILYKERDFWAVSNSDGNAITGFDFMAFKKLSDKLVMLKAKLGGWHLYNIKQRKIVTNDRYESFSLIDDNLIMANRANKYGVIDGNGEQILEFIYSNIHKNEGFLLIEKDAKWGLADRKGKIIIETVHDRLFPFKKNIAVFETKIGKGVIDNKGKIVIPAIYQEIDLKSNLAVCKSIDGKITNLTLDGKPKKNVLSNPPSASVSISKSVVSTASGHAWLKGPGKKWGLVGHDTIFVPFRFIEIIIKGEYTLGGTKIDYRNNARMYGYLNQQRMVEQATLKLALINNYSGKIINQGTSIWYYRIDDFQTGDNAKIIFEGGLQALINKQGKIVQDFSYTTRERKLSRQPFTYIGKFNEQVASFSVGGTMNYAGDWESGKITGGKWGYISQDGKILYEPQYDEAGDFYNGRAIVKVKGQYGVIDRTGNFVIDPIHESISFLENSNHNFFKIEAKKDRFGLIDAEGKTLTRIAFDKIFPFREGMARVMVNGKYGFLDANQQMIVQPIFDNALDFSDGMAAVSLGRLWGFINKEGVQEIIPMSPFVGSYKNGVATASKDGKLTYISKEGRLLVIPKYTFASEFANGMAIVSTDGKKKGIINMACKELVLESYDDIQFLKRADLAKVKSNGEWKLFSLKTFKAISKKSFLEIDEFSNGLALVKYDNYFTYIDTTGKIIFNKKYSVASPFSEGLAKVGLDAKIGFIDTKGAVIIPLTLSNATDFNSTRAFAMAENKLWRIISKTGKNITAGLYSNPKIFSNGLSLVSIGKSLQFIDTLGINIFKQKFELAYSFENGIARVKSEKWGLLNTFGYHYVDNKYDYISEYIENQAVAGLYRSVGIADLNGNFIIDPSFDSVFGINENLFRVEQSDAIGYIKPDKTFTWGLKK